MRWRASHFCHLIPLTAPNEETERVASEFRQRLDEFRQNLTAAEAETQIRLVALETAQQAADKQSADMKSALQESLNLKTVAENRWCEENVVGTFSLKNMGKKCKTIKKYGVVKKKFAIKWRKKTLKNEDDLALS